MSRTTFFENIGNACFGKRRFWLFLALLCAPMLLAELVLTLRFFDLRKIEQSYGAAVQTARGALEKRAEKERFLARYLHSEPYFVNQTLERLPLCRDKIAKLREWAGHPACQQREAIEKRLQALEGPENRLAFAEDKVRSFGRIKESEERLLHPVELEMADLERLLALIENQQIAEFEPDPASPQLQVLDLELTLKDSSMALTKMTLLKREWGLHAENR
jgi:hypothetical protein